MKDDINSSGQNNTVKNHFNPHLGISLNRKSLYFTVDGHTCLYTFCCNRKTSQQQRRNVCKYTWHHKYGVLNGQFTSKSKRGHGGEGKVLAGIWRGKKAAYKFVPVKGKPFFRNMNNFMRDVLLELNEMIQYNETQSDLVVPFYGHYR